MDNTYDAKVTRNVNVTDFPESKSAAAAGAETMIKSDEVKTEIKLDEAKTEISIVRNKGDGSV